MNKLAELRQRRDRVTKEMRAVLDAPAENGELSADQTAAFEIKKAELTAAEAAIAREEAVQDAERRSTTTARIAGGNPVEGDAFGREVRENYSLARAILSLDKSNPLPMDFGREIEFGQEVRRRAGREFGGMPVPTECFLTRATPHERRTVTSAAGSGANLIATDLLDGQYVDRLRNALITQQLGATVLSDLRGNVSIPKNTSGNTAQWFQENTGITPRDKSFGQITLSPKHIGMITEYSRNMLLQSSPDIEMLLRQDFARELAIAIDQAAMNGQGVSDGGSPIGIMRTPGVTTSSAAYSWDAILDLIGVIEIQNSTMTGWAGSAETKKRLMRTPRQASGIEGNFIMTSPTELAGYPFRQSEILRSDSSPSSDILIAGNWPDLLIGYWSGVDLLLNPFESTAFSKANVQLRGVMTADVAVRRVESFAFIE